jgi:endonuclease/exonuclease/phosphatase family metal-dependent hydrolase
MKVTVATMNIAGGARAATAHPHKFALLAQAIRDMDCDVVAAQEVLAVIAADGRMVYNTLRDEILPKLAGSWDWFFYPHLDSWQHPALGKWAGDAFHSIFAAGSEKTALRACMGKSGIPVSDGDCQATVMGGPAGWWQAVSFHVQEGSAVAVRAPWGFKSLLGGRHGEQVCVPPSRDLAPSYQGSRHGHGVTLPWYLGDEACFYQGNRDTTPRSLIMARLGKRGVDIYPDLLFCCTHLATLKEEDPEGGVRTPTENAVALRERQAACVSAYIPSCRDAMLPRGGRVTTLLAGDFNCTPHSAELLPIRKAGLIPLPFDERSGGGAAYTHRKHELPIDLILTRERPSTQARFPNKGTLARVYGLDQLETPVPQKGGATALWASDHHPVYASIGL